MSGNEITYEDVESMLDRCGLEAEAWQKEFLVRFLNTRGPLQVLTTRRY